MNFTVLVSSPADQQKEANAAIEAIEHLSDLLSAYGHSIRCLNWQRNISTGRGERAQGVINEQIHEADVLIAIFGLRIGTDTGKYASGTIEEIESFLEREIGDHPNFDLHVFFNNGAIENPLSIDVEQLKAVQKFRDELNARGVNFGQFSNVDTLRNLVRIGLNEFIARSKPDIDEVENDPLSEFEELGSLEAAEIAEKHLLEATQIMYKIGSSIESTTSKMSNATEHAPTDPSDSVAVKRFFSAVSTLLDESRSDLKPLVDKLSGSLSLNYAYLNLALTIELEDAAASGQRPDYSELRHSINEALESVVDAIDSFSGARTALGHVPRKTSALKRSKRLLEAVYDKMVSTLTDYQSDQTMILKMLESKL